MYRSELYSTGSNSHGQLGLDSDEDFSTYTRVPLPPHSRPKQLAFGANHSLLLATGGGNPVLYGTGSNAAGQLGAGHREARLKFEELRWNDFVPSQAGIKEEDYVVGGVASTWETSLVHLKAPFRWETMNQPAKSDILITFGSNDWGERGVGTTSGEGGGGGDLSSPTIVSFDHLVKGPIRIAHLAAGPRHILAVIHVLDKEEYFLVGWGASRHGQVGPLNRTVKLPKLVARPELVHLPWLRSAQDIASISCGKDHSAILFNSGLTPITFGANKHGQLGPPVTHSTFTSPQYNVPPLLPWSFHLSTELTPGSQPSIHTTWNSTFIALELRDRYSKLSKSYFISFGSNSHGQLGSQKPVEQEQSRQSAAGNLFSNPDGQGIFSSSPAPSPSTTSEIQPIHITTLPPSSPKDPTTLATPLSQSPSPTTTLRLSTGSEHVLALLKPHPLSRAPALERNQELYTWGWNEHGNLGLGADDLTDRREPVKVEGIIREKLKEGGMIEDIWAGMATSWVSIGFGEEDK